MRAVSRVFVSVVGLLASSALVAAGTLVPRAYGWPSANVELTGHGFGHGRGLGQYGALGYALDAGWNYHTILDHYYGGTSVGYVDPNTPMTVDMTSRDGTDTIVRQERGELATTPATGLSCAAGGALACAVRIVRTGSATWRVYEGTGCDGGPAGWRVVADGVRGGSVAVIATNGSTGARQDMLQLCEVNDARWLRGDLWAVDTGSTQVTVNHVALDSYVRGVVPRESPASWGGLGNRAGEQELYAQAVASRSYGMAEERWPWARTCDTTACQVYGGRAVQSDDGSATDLEGTPAYANSDSAVAATAGEVRVMSGSGSVARTEYSSSTGGYTAGGVFPAVIDDGDATSYNPNHTWTVSVPVSTVESAYGQSGLEEIDITGRNGLGDLGGRVAGMRLRFASGSVSTTGAAFAAAVGLRSDWFALTNASVTPYHVLTADGHVFVFGGATSYGSLPSRAGVAATPVGLAEASGGYWVLTADGAVHPLGSARSYGSVAGMRLNGMPRQMASTVTGHGYWIVGADGGVFSFGDAQFYGSTGAMRLNSPVLGMAAAPDGRGYWLVARDGGVFSFGSARFYGSTGAMRLNSPVLGMAAAPDGRGYWLVAREGGVFSFGSARFGGSLPGIGAAGPAVGIAAASTGSGYLIATADGRVYAFGDAVASGGPADGGEGAATVGVAVARSG